MIIYLSSGRLPGVRLLKHILKFFDDAYWAKKIDQMLTHAFHVRDLGLTPGTTWHHMKITWSTLSTARYGTKNKNRIQ